MAPTLYIFGGVRWNRPNLRLDNDIRMVQPVQFRLPFSQCVVRPQQRCWGHRGGRGVLRTGSRASGGRFFRARRTHSRVAAHRSRRSNDDLKVSTDPFHGSVMARLVSNIGSRSPAITILSRWTRNIVAIRRACSASITITRSASLIFDCVRGRERYRDRSRPRCALRAIEMRGTARSLPTKPADVTATSGRLR